MDTSEHIASGAAWTAPLARVDGFALCTASEAIVKGFLETEFEVARIYCVRGGTFYAVVQDSHLPANESVLKRNGVEIIEVHSAVRGVELALQDAARGNSCGVLIPNEELDSVVGTLARISKEQLAETAGICLILEDNPFACEATCPRRVCRRTAITAVEPCDVAGVRDGVDTALRLSRCTGKPSAMVVHVSLLRSAGTLLMAPNRQVARVDHAAWLKRRRSVRAGDATDALQMVRRLESNRLEHLPSPGEREQYGFIAIGTGAVAVAHMLDELDMSGRVPLFRLGVLEPLDALAIRRLLARCHHVIVVEPRPGSVAPRIVAIAQAMHGSEETPAQVWWDALPAAAGDVERLGINDGLRTSLLTRRVIRLLHEVRPGLQLEERLAQVPAWVANIELPRRGAGIGRSGADDRITAAVDAARGVLAARGELSGPRRGIALETGPAPDCDVCCTLEVWDRRRFSQEAIALIRQVPREIAPRIVIVLDFGWSEDVDIERVSRAAAGADAERRLLFSRIDLHDQEEMRDAILLACDTSALTIIIASDGPPPRIDTAALERAAQEVDRAGFLRLQRFVLPADNACELRDPGLAIQVARGLLRGSDPLRPDPLVEKSVVPGAKGIFVRLESLYEQVEIIRTRPPAALDELRASVRLTPPRPIHAEQGMWRVHLAGFRGDAPGVAGQLLAEAGRAMGFRVEWTHQGAAIGPGRKAWSQLVFARLDDGRTDGADDPAGTADSGLARSTVQIPYGEADLVLGLDPVETIRALATDTQLRVADPQHTAIVANTAPLEDQIDPEFVKAASQLAEVAQVTSLGGRRVLLDLVSEVRTVFLTDRPTDVVLLGLAFQRGLIPVSIEALEAAARRLESRGYARSFEALQLGRTIAGRFEAEDPEVSAQVRDWRARADARRLVRRVSGDRQLGGRRERARGRRLATLVSRELESLWPIRASREGREALVDLATAVRRCEIWGGFEYAARYCRVIAALRAGGTGSASMELSRLAILPLAELFLIRDLWYVGALTTSLDQSHRIRETLGVRLARGDEIRRRYLHRFELRLASRRWVVEFRSSDWPDRILRTTLPLIPVGLRGTEVQRSAREVLVLLLEKAGADDSRLAQWTEFARLLHERALAGTIRGMTSREIEAAALASGAIAAPLSIDTDSGWLRMGRS